MKKERIIYRGRRGAVACALLVLSMFCCVNEYNPFDDSANACTHIVRSSCNSDSIPVFTTDSLELLFTVCNLIQKVKVQAKKNRFFDTLTIDDVCKKRSLYISFYDTGYQKIRIVTFRENGDSVELIKSYHVYLGIEQESAIGQYGDTLHLNAKVTKDRDKNIQYVWNIGSGKPVISPFNTATIPVLEPLSNDSGELRICDNTAIFFSPPVFFPITLLEATPEIVIKNGDRDTFFTNGESLVLWVKVEKSMTRDSVYVNGSAMADIGSNNFVKTIQKTDSTIQKISIVSIDRMQKRTSRTAYVVFNSNRQESINPKISILERIVNGTATVMRQKYTLEGTIEYYANEKLDFTVSLYEGNLKINSMEISSDRGSRWAFPIELKNNANTVIRVELSDVLKNAIADTTLMINYCNDCIDTAPPTIAVVMVDNEVVVSSNSMISIDSYISDSERVSIELVCFDESGVDSVFMNNKLMESDSGTGYRWRMYTKVHHIEKPDTLAFYAVDKKGNRSNWKKVIIGYNSRPYIVSHPDSIEHALTGKLYVSNIDIHDEDTNDFVTYSIYKSDVRNIIIDEKGTIKWTPEKSDTGFRSVKIQGEDQNREKVYYSYLIYVSEMALDSVRLVTSRNELPNLLPCNDSINIPLRVRGGTGPYVFEITDKTKKDTIPVNQAQPYFKWKPDCTSDTGAHQFFIIVRDKLRLSDTLWPVVTVLPSNRDFEIKELRWTGSRKTDNVLDLSKKKTDTLYYAINDPDNPQYERHIIEVASGTEKYTITTDSGKFLVPLSHLARKTGQDSLILSIRDKGDHVKRIVKRLDYGSPPVAPTLLKPHNDTIIESKDIAFRWSSHDPDGEPLIYHFTLQFADETFQVNKELQDTFCTVLGLKKAGVYYWSVIANDSKSSIASLTGKITCLPDDRVRIDTTVLKLPELISCKTSIKAPIVIRNGYPPFTFKCSSPFVVEGDSLAWIADCKKTGAYKINLIVEDSVGNTDSYTFNTSIYGSDSLDLKMINEVPRNGKNEIDLSGPAVKTVVCTLAIIDPDPSPPEKFIIEVFLGNIQQHYFNNYIGRTFFVSLKPDLSKKSDTLYVNVTDMNGNKKDLTEIINYGN